MCKVAYLFLGGLQLHSEGLQIVLLGCSGVYGGTLLGRSSLAAVSCNSDHMCDCHLRCIMLSELLCLWTQAGLLVGAI